MKGWIYLTVVLVGFWFNAYKYNLMNSEPYHIFPWSPFPQTAKSSAGSLRYHLVTALSILIATWLRINSPDDDRTEALWILIHYFFLFGVLPNISHLGDFSAWIAVTVNVSSLTMLQICLMWDYPQIYFWVLSTPVILEVIAYIGNQLVLH